MNASSDQRWLPSSFSEYWIRAKRKRLLSQEHFTVDGTLIEAWASMKSFKPKDSDDGPPSAGGKNPSVDFKGKKLKSDTHGSATDPDAKLYRKRPTKEAKLGTWATR